MVNHIETSGLLCPFTDAALDGFERPSAGKIETILEEAHTVSSGVSVAIRMAHMNSVRRELGVSAEASSNDIDS
ncbi:hypothetical protein BTH42_19375 [Burkholderia sp. SRS-W-2-2016]|uniref:hypothetical protein n=1 Tax=Burkholderia sp. SRS-W-2-2016 TaxID=1926878 RepID=UPI00094AE997|nr:hypothetical protein [Burkholderia sp. SRS-W-2-2016]OLL29986.1 hypothetical protein BTH42_19375 [Burkholderia sp. SRS-W-2-2016]